MSQAVFISGQWIAGEGEELRSVNPVTGDLIWQGNTASAAQVEDALKAARAAFRIWRRTDFSERNRIVEQFVALLKENTEELAELIGSETGKPLWESKTEVAAMIGKAAISLRACEARTGYQEAESAQGRTVLRHKPHGVVAVFGPYNFPGHLPNGHIIPALLAGNAVVFKPSEQTPAVAVKTIELWQQAGLPEGVINLVCGARETGVALAGSDQLDGLFFTGSSDTGHILHRQFGGRPDKIMALEMGGNNPLVLGSSFNPEGALHHTLSSAFLSAGQRCTCARRLMVAEGSAGDEFLRRLSVCAAGLTVGHYNDDPQPFMGALVSAEAASGVLAGWHNLVELGGTPLLEMQSLRAGTGLLSPGIIDLTGVENVPDQEYFGPLLSVYRYSSFAEALELANNTAYGLSAGLISDDQNEYDYFMDEIRAGIVNWNKPLTGASSAAPFGGVGASGNHRPSAYYAADYCAYPVASMESATAEVPASLPPGMQL